jgi:hypothetical protein
MPYSSSHTSVMPLSETQVEYSVGYGTLKPVLSDPVARITIYADQFKVKPPSRPTATTTKSWKNLFCHLRFKLFFCQPCLMKTENGDMGRFEKEIERNSHATTMLWKVAIFLSVAVAVIAVFRAKPVYEYYEDRTSEWTWDRNVYLPRSGAESNSIETFDNSDTETASGTQIALIAQVTEGLAMKQISEVATRPNRAYVRHWKMDYVQYYAGRVSYSSKSCFDKAFVLQTLAENQIEEAKDPAPHWPHAPRVRYDAVLLLPSDAIVMDMDENIIDVLLPREKLVAIAGWTTSREKFSSNSGVVLFNMRHRHALQVIKLWWDISQEPYKTCGAENGISTLIDAIAAVMDLQKGETLDDLIKSIPEHPSGMLSDHIIKCLPSSVPGSRSEIFLSKLQQSGEVIHQTADSVCYRFYPKCEVVP